MIGLIFIFQAGLTDEARAFDLRNLKSDRPSGDVIIVTGRRRDDRLPLRAGAEELLDPLLPRAETGLIGKSRIGVEARQQALGGGTVSNRAMVTVKVPF